ncbi:MULTISPECIES: phosphoribosylformylglycinamidine synthase subunit PurS [Fructobacillus]|jgi:phosphoribosylformylglycinamidine synthase subunit PurS|uniref:Phosphoribosylformylglycinamidine synthase subunit PurS n=1 Tax=Fructobacillus cardui TaxID=2893170 RepID=A0ABM9MTC1_9LACO|nr:phosphoribosylformylglycinamidine synthase subunit PurS [Fructobacillus sp. EFB-N1]CAK1238672.1 Phosphoribosylformylglycinamidine (FGAM) synthase [Fructobacillus cardui]CAK1249011.1 Phosphoribosylformylglycinamidine (FGAM) synthase [Fructobacillus tropaeoli]KMK52976.1 phosphoribosylformylglycinamidine synthase subunit PurS [Fructobacillus sp. EFB-N1]CAK1247154.1 Phosphoribosylformylglycinamidine (FGAM) synthase [Fructobacillus cardui]CAK1248332.1 Phosphoribosylformylglycinamidine (FGAM) syn
MYLAKIYVTYKPSILDPQGVVIKSALERLEYQGIEDVSQGKYFQVKLTGADKAAVAKEVESLVEELLINHNTETYTYDLEEI